jgi:hypothetical protein
MRRSKSIQRISTKSIFRSEGKKEDKPADKPTEKKPEDGQENYEGE